MKMSKEISNISKAFIKAQIKIETPEKDKVNPFYKSKYSDIGGVLTASKKHLNSEGIAILQPTFGNYVQTILLHESGEWFMGKTKIINGKPNDPQAQGIAITYARRYGLQSMLGMGGEDNDGEGAMDREKDEEVSTAQKDKTFNPKPITAPQNDQPNICSQCGVRVDDDVKGYSLKKYGKVLCRDCQKLS